MAVLPSGEVDHEEGWVHVRTPGATALTVFHRATEAGLGGSAHFGFRAASAEEIRAAASAVISAGGELIEQDEIQPGQPYLFARDPDGYMFEVWYE